MKKILVFIHDGYADYEASYVCGFLVSSQEARVETLAPAIGYVTSKGGLRTLVDHTLSENIDPKLYDALILIGGSYWKKVAFKDARLTRIIDSFVNENKLVGSICDASTFLASNGYFDHIPHTGNGKDYFLKMCPNYKGESLYQVKETVISLPFISANGAGGIEFGKAFADALNIKTQEERDFWFNMQKSGFYKKWEK